jgi:hypothetical protein
LVEKDVDRNIFILVVNFVNKNGGTYGICTHVRGFADRCVTTPPRRHV